MAPLHGRPHLGVAVLDRLCQASHRIAMKGSSMRKRQPPTTEEVNNAVTAETRALMPDQKFHNP